MLIAGCSHAAGSEINGQEDSVYNRQHSFGALTARHLGYRPVSIAKNGMTNPGIARSILNWFLHNYDPEKMEVFVLVAWTESTRMEIHTGEMYGYNLSSKAADWYDKTADRYLRITFGWDGSTPEEKAIVPKYHRFMSENEKFLETFTMQLVLQLQFFFNSKNVKYLMCNSSHVFSKDSSHLVDYCKLVDNTKYFNMLQQDEAFYTKYKNLGYKNDKAKYWHHDEIPHKLYAEELIQFLEKTQ